MFEKDTLLIGKLISLTAATREFPARMSRGTIERLVRSGAIASIKIDGCYYTTKLAIRFYIRNKKATK